MTTKHFGEEGLRSFWGVVADITDPHQLGRVKVRIFGIHDNTSLVSDEDLPWAQVLMPVTSASLSGVGMSPTGIAPDSYVFGVFLDGMEGQFPLIMGTFHKMPNRDPNLSDVNVLARGTNKLKKKQTGPEPASAYKAQYPKNIVFESKSGHVIEIDDTDGDERIHIYHRKGTYIEVNKDGRVVIKSVDSSIDVTDKQKTIYAKDTIKIESEKSIDIVAKDNITMSAKNVKISGGSSTLKMASGLFNADSKNIKVKGKYVNVDAPVSKVSGASIQSGKVSAKNVLAKNVTAKGVKSKVTGGLSSALGGIKSKLGGLGDLGSLSTVGDLGAALNGAFGDIAQQVTDVTSSIGDGALINIDSLVNQVDGALDSIDSMTASIDSTIDSAISSFDDQINKKISKTLDSATESAVDEIIDSTSSIWS